MAKSGTGRVTVMGKKRFFIQTELDNIPLQYRSYIKANRDFLQLLIDYHLLLDGLDIAKPLVEWMDVCVCQLSEFEALIQQDLDNKISFSDFESLRQEYISTFESSLDECGILEIQNTSRLTKRIEHQFQEIETLLERVHQKIRNAGYEVYHSWINAK